MKSDVVLLKSLFHRISENGSVIISVSGTANHSALVFWNPFIIKSIGTRIINDLNIEIRTENSTECFASNIDAVATLTPVILYEKKK